MKISFFDRERVYRGLGKVWGLLSSFIKFEVIRWSGGGRTFLIKVGPYGRKSYFGFGDFLGNLNSGVFLDTNAWRRGYFVLSIRTGGYWKEMANWIGFVETTIRIRINQKLYRMSDFNETIRKTGVEMDSEHVLKLVRWLDRNVGKSRFWQVHDFDSTYGDNDYTTYRLFWHKGMIL